MNVFSSGKSVVEHAATNFARVRTNQFGSEVDVIAISDAKAGLMFPPSAEHGGDVFCGV
jgi:hypothetical protein